MTVTKGGWVPTVPDELPDWATSTGLPDELPNAGLPPLETTPIFDGLQADWLGPAPVTPTPDWRLFDAQRELLYVEALASCYREFADQLSYWRERTDRPEPEALVSRPGQTLVVTEVAQVLWARTRTSLHLTGCRHLRHHGSELLPDLTTPADAATYAA